MLTQEQVSLPTQSYLIFQSNKQLLLLEELAQEVQSLALQKEQTNQLLEWMAVTKELVAVKDELLKGYNSILNQFYKFHIYITINQL